MAGAIAELARRALDQDFRNIDPERARIVLIEGGERLISGFPPKLSDACLRSLAKLGVEVRLRTYVGGIDADGVDTEGGRIAAKTVVWCAGVRPTPAAEWLGVEPDRQGRVVVERDLSVPGRPGVFVVGDCARVIGKDGQPLPGVAQPAMQEGAFVARAILARCCGDPAARRFEYRDKGDMATIGRKMAVARVGRFAFSGYLAWVVWLVVHIWYLIGFRNRVLTMIDWAWAYVTFERGARLIVKD
jgi:NADH dehydrogenase